LDERSLPAPKSQLPRHLILSIVSSVSLIQRHQILKGNFDEDDAIDFLQFAATRGDLTLLLPTVKNCFVKWNAMMTRMRQGHILS
jgi:hypothetical protein